MDDTPPTPEDVLRFGTVSGDAVVIGQVGTGSSGVAIGSNITQIIYPAGALPADNPEWEKRRLTLPVEPPGAPILFVGRNEELLKLHHYLDELAAPLRAGQHRGGRMVLVYGAVGVGKRELVRQWLADLRVQPAPIVARTTFLPAELSDQVSDDYYGTHPAWELGWGVHGEQVRQYFLRHSN
ncbi:MAG: hypothetical protein IPK16_05240 [Anaerolineales bacterium]|nr:hypothetical protein [Anaerolineales bacterium]